MHTTLSRFAVYACRALASTGLAATPRLAVSGVPVYHPLDPVTVTSVEADRVQVRDGAGHVYWQSSAAPEVTFRAGGALGVQKFEALDASGRVTATVEFMTRMSRIV